MMQNVGHLFGKNCSWESTHSIELIISWWFYFYWFRWRSGGRIGRILSLHDLEWPIRKRGKEEKEESSFIEDEEKEGSISGTNLFAEFDDFYDIITDDSDDDGYLAQALGDRWPSKVFPFY